MTFLSSRRVRETITASSSGLAVLAAVLLAAGTTVTASADEIRLGRNDSGARGRIGFLAGDTVGRSNSLTHFELMPYWRTQDGVVLGDVRFFLSDGDVGANFGLGYRSLVREVDRVFGGIVWFDIDELSGEQAQQVTVSLESYGEAVDALANLYIPVGEDTVGALTTQNQRFVGNQLLFDQSGTLGDVMGGGDVQIGYRVPGRLARDHQLRLFAGAYHYSGDSADDINGFLARIEATFFGAFDSQLKLTTDDTFGTNVLFGVSVGFSGGFRQDQWRSCEPDAVTRYPTRQYNAVVVDQTISRTGLVAADPETGNAWSFSHVNSAASGTMDGSVESPWNNIASALAGGSDYVLVHGNSVFTGADAAVVLADGQRLWGEGPGIEHMLQAEGAGSLILPSVVGGAAPVLQGSASNSVTMASGSELIGFTIDSSGGSGVVLDGISDARVSQVSVLNAAVDGVRVANISGSVSVLDTSVTDAGGAALRIDGVTGDVTATGTYVNTTGQALVLANIGSSANVDLSGATFSNDSGSGLMFQQVGGHVTLSDVSLSDSGDAGIHIDGGSGTIAFAGTTTIQSAIGDAIRIHNSDADVTFESLVIRDAGGAGISVLGNTNTASLNVTGTTSISGSAAEAIRIEENDGAVTFGALDIETAGGAGIVITDTEGQVQFDESVSIVAEQLSGDSPLQIHDSAADVVFVGDVTITNATGHSAVNLQNNTGSTSFASLNVDSNGSAAVHARDAGSLAILDGSVTTTDGAAFDIADSATDISLTTVTVDGGDFGIRLEDTTGSFIINGDMENTPGSGGSIMNTGHGILAANTGVIGVRHMSFDQNEVAVQVDRGERFAMWDSVVTSATEWALDLQDVENVEVVTSDFADNANTFRFIADTDQAHAVLLSDVQVDAGTATAVQVVGTSGAELTVAIENSVLLSTADDESLIQVQADGVFSFEMTDTRLQTSGDRSTLLSLNATSTTDLARFTVYNNLLSASGSSSTGIYTSTAGPSQIQYEQNSVVFAAERGVGMDFELAGSATVGIYSNLITDNFDGATAILMRSVDGPSRIEFAGNELQFGNLGGLSDRGFIFEDVTGDVSLLGAIDNIVGGASVPWFVPAGRTNGSFLVNGVRVP